MSTILSIYAAVLSTLLAVPKVLELWRNFFSPIKFICRSYAGMDAKKEDKSDYEMIELFDIVVINKSKETQHFSGFNLEFKQGSEIMLFASGSGMINSTFPYKLESGANFREYARISQRQSDLSEKNQSDLKVFSKFRVTLENSIGKKYKSKWYKHKIIVNNKKARWEKLKNLDDYNRMLSGVLN